MTKEQIDQYIENIYIDKSTGYLKLSLTDLRKFLYQVYES